MKRDVAAFVERCLACQQVKALHQRPYGKLQPLEIPEWKWEHITMDFVTALPRTLKGNTAIWSDGDRTLEDMLRAVVLDQGGSWETALPLIEFAYNNSFQATFGMAPYEALYGRKCRFPLYWDEVGERRALGLDAVEEMVEIVRQIRARMKEAQDRQKSYADVRRTDLQFQDSDKVFLKLRKYVFDPKHVIRYEEVAINPDLSYEEQPQMILDRKVQTSRNKSTAFMKIQWRNHGPEEATWELEDKMMELYPELFP
ncbi:uncharacterized protein LOC125189629 [Salvia hispanica]|uniref:uncharacterized protein LOC125189629 n=1 Tax=Salvia hispanica TaxID=49212 RepID=UPI0020097186|nr:uncharacterized protein LOC125189629 [Salvia hispanica]